MQSTTGSIRVGIVDDHVILTASLAAMINTIPGFSAVLQAKSGQDLLEQLKGMTELPNILLMDIAMEHMNGIEATRHVRDTYPSVKVIALTVLGSLDTVIKMLRAGSCAYLKKAVTPAELEHALKEVHEKGKYYGDVYNRNGRELVIYEKEKMKESLAENEIKFIELTCKGLVHHEIAEVMRVSPHTIQKYRVGVFKKLMVNSSVMMVLEALRREIIQL